MPMVLSTGSRIVCAHGGTVQPKASQSKLMVGGRQVLVLGDLQGAQISGCLTPNAPAATPPTKQCLTIASMITGQATKLSADGKPVLLETAAGLTDGLPLGSNTWRVQSAGQTKLETL